MSPKTSSLRKFIPTREQLLANRWLAWLRPFLSHPMLWRWSRRGVALGVALGVFFGLLIPIAQIPVSAAAAVVLRANIPAAAASTLVTNPVTFGPVYYAAYQLGNWLTGDNTPTQSPTPETVELSLVDHITDLGLPLITGLAVMATLFGLLSYLLISVFWIWRVRRKRRQSAGRYRGQ